MVASTSSHQALLDIIQAKESELDRIRHAANVAAEEEKNISHQHFQELKQDFDHNARLLHDREENIKSLTEKIQSIERDHVESIRMVEGRYHELMNRHVDQIEHRFEEDFRQSRDAFEQQQRKLLQKEFEDKMSCREREIQAEHKSLIVDELRMQEERIQRKFEKVMDEKENLQKQVEQEMKSQLAKYEKAAEIEYWELEQKWRSREKAMAEDLKGQQESKLEIQLEASRREHRRNILDHEHAMETTMRGMAQLNQEKTRLQNEIGCLEAKIGELLNILQSVEKDQHDRSREAEEERRHWQKQLQAMSEHLASMEMNFRNEEARRHKDRIRMKRQAKEQQKILTLKVKELKREMSTMICERNETEQTLEVREGETERNKRRLKVKVKTLTKECNCLHDEISALNSKMSKDRHEEAAKKEELDFMLLNGREASAAAQKKIIQQYERTSQRDREAYAEEKQQLIKERDTALTNNKSIELEVENKDEQIATMMVQITNLAQDIEILRGTIKQLETKRVEILKENSKLQNTVTGMRKEMEELITSCSATVNDQAPPIPQSTSERISENGTKYDLNNVLTDLNRYMKESLQPKKKHNFHEPPSEHQDNNVMRDLQNGVQHLNSKYDTVSAERDNLIEVTNKLKSDLSKLEDAKRDQNLRRLHFEDECNEDELYLSQHKYQGFEGIDVDDLAKSVWKKATRPPTKVQKEAKIGRTASNRSTTSQEARLQKMRMTKNRKAEKVPPRVRNWNIKDEAV